MEAWRVHRPVVAGSHHFDEDQDQDPDSHLSEKLDPDSHRTEKLDLDPHLRENLYPDPHKNNADPPPQPLCSYL
jgi:hypothetical protein